MATRREEMRVGVIATDDASKIIGDVADKVSKLDGETADVTVTAADKASDDIAELRRRLSTLSAEQYQAHLTAEAKKLDAEIKRANTALANLDVAEAEAVLAAKDEITAKAKAVQDELDKVDRIIADPTVDLTDLATGDIRQIGALLDDLDDNTYDPTVDATEGAGLTGIFDKVEGMPGSIGAVGGLMSKLASPGGAALVFGAALAAAATQTSNMALDVNSLANFTGEDFAYTDQFLQVARTWGDLDLNDLFEIIAELQQKMTQMPELAEKFGLDPQWVADNPLEGIVALIDAIRDSSLSAAEKSQAMFQLLGEEGAKQLIPLLTNVEDLSALVEGMPSLVDREDVERALDLQKTINSLKTNFGELASNASPLIGLFDGLLTLAGDIAGVGKSAWEWLSTPFGGDDNGIENRQEWLDGIFGSLQTGMPLLDAFKKAWEEEGADPDKYAAGWLSLKESLAKVQGLMSTGLPLAEAWNIVFSEGGDGAAANAVGLGLVSDALDTTTDAAEDNAEANREAAEAAAEHARASREDLVAALEDQRDALEENIDALTDYVDAQSAAYDKNVAYREAQEATTDATARYLEVLKEQPDDLEAVRDAGQAVVENAVDQAVAFANLQEAQAKASGAAYTATQRVRDQNAEFARQAATIDVDLLPQLADAIAQYNGIPEQKETILQLLKSGADPAVLAEQLNSMSGTYTASVQIDADQAKLAAVAATIAQVAAAAERLDRTRSAYVTPTQTTKSGRQFTAATGTPFSNEGVYEVGEQGRERVYLPAGSRVVANHSLDDQVVPVISNTYVTNNFPAGVDARTWQDAMRDFERRGGIRR